ncbi:hypothetical protein V7S79_06130 [Aquirufa sp. ROCK-SH2]
MKKLILFTLGIALLSSCSQKAYLTGSLMTLIKDNQLPLNKIQFYNDNALFLERELNASDANVKSGKVILVNGKNINRVSLESQTPGVLVKEQDKQLLISFEAGAGEEKSLHFAPIIGERGESFYQLVDDSGSPTFSRLNYDGNKYLLYNTKKVRLMIMKSSFSGLKVNSKRMRGNKIK